MLKIIRHDQVGCKLEMQGWFHIRNSIHIIHSVNILQDKCHVIISKMHKKHFVGFNSYLYIPS